MNNLESALHTLADDGSGNLARPDLADQVLHRARQRRRHRGALAAASAATAVVLLAVGASAVGQPHHSAPGPAAAPKSAASAKTLLGTPRINVLVIGSDAAPSRIGLRPDTMIVASIDTRTGATALFGLPRNLTHVPFPAGTPQAAAFPDGFFCPAPAAEQGCTLNSLWFWASGKNGNSGGAKYYRSSRNPGLTATTQAAEQITGLSVDDTVMLNTQGLQDLVDAVGGVNVNVTERLPIGGSTEHPVATHGYLEPGRQHLTGFQALWFAESRWSTNDTDRMGRQQCLVSDLVQQVNARKLVTAYPRIAAALKKNLSTSILADQLPQWAELVGRMRGARVQHIGLGVDNTQNPDYAQLHEQVKQVISGSTPPAATKAKTGSGFDPKC